MFKRKNFTEWEVFQALVKRQLIDGTWAAGTLMRRRVWGEWQYRAATEEELEANLLEQAW